MPRLTLGLALLCAALPLLAAPTAPAQGGGSAPGGTPPGGSDGDDKGGKPCRPSGRPRLRCPDLILRMPANRYFRRAGGRLLYHASNSIVNIGPGPVEVLGHRTGPGTMRVTQQIYGEDGTRHPFPSPGRLVFKNIPGQGPYWKFENAARFEIWTLRDDGALGDMVRTGPKLIYCLRDLNKRASLPFSPPRRHYPACSQDASRLSVTLGTSVGWADEYPAPYHEQWIDVTGLRGRFGFVQRVDPLNHLHEYNEKNNVSPRVFMQLPPARPPARRSGDRSY